MSGSSNQNTGDASRSQGPPRGTFRPGQHPQHNQTGQQPQQAHPRPQPELNHAWNARFPAQLPTHAGLQGRMGAQGPSSMGAPQGARPYTVAFYRPNRPAAAVSIAAPPSYLPGGANGASRMRASVETGTVDWFFDRPGEDLQPSSQNAPVPNPDLPDRPIQRTRSPLQSGEQNGRELVRTGPGAGTTDSRVWDTDPEVADSAREELQQDLIRRLDDVGRDIMRLARADAEPSPAEPNRNWEGQPTFEGFVQYRLTQTIENARTWNEAWEYSNLATRRDEGESEDDYESDPEGSDDEDDDSDVDDPPSPPPPYSGVASSGTLTNNGVEGSGVHPQHDEPSQFHNFGPLTSNPNPLAVTNTGTLHTQTDNAGTIGAEGEAAAPPSERAESISEDIESSTSSTGPDPPHHSQSVNDDQHGTNQDEGPDGSSRHNNTIIEPNEQDHIEPLVPNSAGIISVIVAVEVAILAVVIGSFIWNLG